MKVSSAVNHNVQPVGRYEPVSIEQIESKTEKHGSVSDLLMRVLLNQLSLTFRDRQCRTPLITKDVKANTSVRVDIRVINLRGEGDLWRLERVVGGLNEERKLIRSTDDDRYFVSTHECNAQEEDTASVRGITLQCRQ